MIEWEGMDDEVTILLKGSNLTESEVLKAGLMLGYSNLYIDYGIHSVLSYFSKISTGGYLSYEVLKSKLYYTYVEDIQISKAGSYDSCMALAGKGDKITIAKFLFAIDVEKKDNPNSVETIKLLCQRTQKHEENYLKLVDMIGKLQTDAPIIGDKICDAYTDMLSCPNLDI